VAVDITRSSSTSSSSSSSGAVATGRQGEVEVEEGVEGEAGSSSSITSSSSSGSTTGVLVMVVRSARQRVRGGDLMGAGHGVDRAAGTVTAVVVVTTGSDDNLVLKCYLLLLFSCGLCRKGCGRAANRQACRDWLSMCRQ